MCVNIIVYSNIYTDVNKNLVDILKFGNKCRAPWGTKRHANRQAIFKASERVVIGESVHLRRTAWPILGAALGTALCVVHREVR